VVTPAPAGPVACDDPPGIRVHAVRYPGDRVAGGLTHGRGLPETLGAAPWTAALVPPMLDAFARAALERACDGGFDRVWSHWLLPGGWIGAGVARAARVPHHVTAHGSDIHLVERLTRLPGARHALTHAWRHSVVTATSTFAAQRIARALPGVRVRVCPLPAAAGDARPADGPPELLFLGRFEPVKGPDLLLDASARVPAGALARVTLAGAGSLDRILRERARELDHPVAFPGVLAGSDKRAMLERAHALVVPSRRMNDGRIDGLPHVALEALAVGTPVIAPDEGALGDLLRRTGAGLTYPAHPHADRRSANLAELLRSIGSAPARLRDLRVRARRAGRAFQMPAALAAWQCALQAGA
jgi:glycosyltransferase involved in cell wall biosynthesis